MRHAILPHFMIPWHFHPELELMYVLKGEGTRVVGDSIQSFGPGDFVFVGSGIPHLWRNDDRYYKDLNLEVECLLLFFKEEVLTGNLLEIPEMNGIKSLINTSQKGIRFGGEKSNQLKELMRDAYPLKGVDRVLAIIRLLDAMSKFENPEILCGPDYIPDVNHRDRNRLDKCLQHIIDNYRTDIKLPYLAEMANMTPNSFCRYFKKRTTMSFSQFLIEHRIRKASQLLLETEMKIIEIAYETGFRSLSNFNSHFKRLRGMSPRTYRNKVYSRNLEP